MPSTDDRLYQAEQYCLKQGIKLTSKRKLVLACLLSADKPLSAYDLADFCKLQFAEALPVMSVYRSLTFLVNAGLAHKLNMVNKYVACSFGCCEHDHTLSQFLICQSCHKVSEIKLSQTSFNEVNDNIQQAGFSLSGSQLEFSCICHDCLANAG